jgi:3-polyprenyl-4-hydroxybenzoate decarboxylase
MGVGCYSMRLAYPRRVRHALRTTIADAHTAQRLIVHPNKDVGAVIASGSFLHDGMVVCPCSS